MISLMASIWRMPRQNYQDPNGRRMDEKARMLTYIGIERLQELLASVGTGGFIEELAAEIESDYLRWDEFEKSPRHASHSAGGVIELMPASDGRMYAFKYVNGHPKNTAAGLLTV